jgi:nitroreductase
MTELLPLDPDQLLTTTRAVRKRLDLDRDVPLEVVREAIEIAVQAPSGSNNQRWHWIIVTDPALKRRVGDLYARAHTEAYAGRAEPTDAADARLSASSVHLREVMGRVPVQVIAAIERDVPGLPEGNQAGLWGSLLPAAWSLALALRARGLGTTWTTLHLGYEREVADVLGLPENVHQGVLLPVAYTVGTVFKPGPRRDLDPIIHVNGW